MYCWRILLHFYSIWQHLISSACLDVPLNFDQVYDVNFRKSQLQSGSKMLLALGLEKFV